MIKHWPICIELDSAAMRKRPLVPILTVPHFHVSPNPWSLLWRFSFGPKPMKPKLHLYLFCPALGCWQLYLPIRNALWAGSLGSMCRLQVWGPTFNITVDSKTKPQQEKPSLPLCPGLRLPPCAT